MGLLGRLIVMVAFLRRLVGRGIRVLIRDECGGGVLEQGSWIFFRERETYELVSLKFRGFSIVLF